MALATAFLSEDQFTCSICLEVFNNPVSIPCGHSFCHVCISTYWDKGGATGVCQCPLCKESFQERPELHINRTLKEITEQFKQIVNNVIPMDRGERGVDSDSHLVHQSAMSLVERPGEMPESVFAEMMTRFRKLANTGGSHSTLPDPNTPHPYSSRSADAHLSIKAPNIEYNVHDEPLPSYSPRCSGPSVSSPSLHLCPIHLRGLDFFCRTDNTCICKICVDTAEHSGHSIVPAKREWHIKKSQLGISEVDLKDLIDGKERKVKEIQNALREIQAAAERQIDGAVCHFSKLISTVEHCQAEVLEVIEMRRLAAEHRVQSLLKELEEEITELKKRSTALSQLAFSEDYVHFFKMFPALSNLPRNKEWSNVSVDSELTSGVIPKILNHMIENIQKEIRKLPEACQLSSLEKSVPKPNPKIKRVQDYAADITLDPYTAHPRLNISVDGKEVYCGDHHQPVPDNPERFDRVVCVLAHQGFNSGRHYWEVEVGEKTDWDLGVASSTVNRKGKIIVSPSNGYWFLSLRDRTDYAFRTEPSTSLTVNIKPSRIGIYVDFDKGVMSFYNVEARVLIFSFTDTFSDTIHPFFSPCTNKSGKNEAPLIICPVATTE